MFKFLPKFTLMAVGFLVTIPAWEEEKPGFGIFDTPAYVCPEDLPSTAARILELRDFAFVGYSRGYFQTDGQYDSFRYGFLKKHNCIDTIRNIDRYRVGLSPLRFSGFVSPEQLPLVETFLKVNKPRSILIIQTPCFAQRLRVRGHEIWYTGTSKITIDDDGQDHDENIFMGLAKNGVSHGEASEALVAAHCPSFDAD